MCLSECFLWVETRFSRKKNRPHTLYTRMCKLVKSCNQILCKSFKESCSWHLTSLPILIWPFEESSSWGYTPVWILLQRIEFVKRNACMNTRLDNSRIPYLWDLLLYFCTYTHIIIPKIRFMGLYACVHTHIINSRILVVWLYFYMYTYIRIHRMLFVGLYVCVCTRTSNSIISNSIILLVRLYSYMRMHIGVKYTHIIIQRIRFVQQSFWWAFTPICILI